MASGGITGFPIGGIVDTVSGSGQTRTPTAMGFQHGSGAIRSGGSQPPTMGNSARPRSASAASSHRPRSRDRGRYPRAPMQVEAEERYRSQPAGPQEAEDWTVALEALSDRLDTLERYSRLHGQSIAHIEEDRTMLLGKVLQ